MHIVDGSLIPEQRKKTLIPKEDRTAEHETFDDGETWEKPPDILLRKYHHPTTLTGKQSTLGRGEPIQLCNYFRIGSGLLFVLK